MNTLTDNTTKKEQPVINQELIELAIQICVVTSHKPAILTKTKKKDANGNIITEPGGFLVKGEVENVTINSMADLDDLCKKASEQKNIALIAAKHTHPDNKVGLYSRDAYLAAGEPANAITRTKENFIRPVNKPGIMIFDCDDANVTPDEFINTIKDILPMEGVAYRWDSSSGSNIFDGNTPVTGITGQRLYVPVNDASDIPRVAQIAFDRLWLKGAKWGYYKVSKSGAMLKRGLFDMAMFGEGETNRLDFAAGANCIHPVNQRRPKSIVVEGKHLDTAQVKKLSINEQRDLAMQQDDRAEEVDRERQEKREKFQTATALRMLERKGVKTPTEEQLRETKNNVALAQDGQKLSGDFIITLEDGKEVTIAEVLNNKDYYDRKRTRDPLEPEYKNNKVTGILYLVNCQPRLFSRARGDTSYKLHKQSRFVQHVGGESTTTTDITLDIMRSSGHYYDMADNLVFVEGGQVRVVDEDLLRYKLGGDLQYFTVKVDSKGNETEININPPTDVIRNILALRSSRGLKQLKAIIAAPTITTDGYIISRHGYDERTQLYLSVTDALTPPSGKPSATEVKAAYKLIMSVLNTFKLDTKLDKSVALCAVLSAVTRQTLETAPGFIMDAPTYGSGKTFLANTLSLLVTGKNGAMTPAIKGNNEPEISKVLLSLLMTAPQTIIWDNVEGAFNSTTIATLLTSDKYNGRVLGASKTVDVPNRASFYITSNNAQVHSDLARRFLTIRMDTKEQNAIDAIRDYSELGGLHTKDFVIQNRQRLVMAAITIIKAWLVSEERKQHGKLSANLLPSYELWDMVARQPVLWLAQQGYELTDPKQSIDDVMANDKGTEQLTILFNALHNIYQDKPFTARRLFKDHLTICPDDDPLFELITTLARRKDFTTYSISDVLRNRRGRIADGLRLELHKEDSKRGHQYKMVKVV